MNPLLSDLLELLELERLEDNLFRGSSRDIGTRQVFGGQVLGQALTAASRTVEDRVVHSLHAYFLRAGDIEAPIVYDVDRARDGRSFTNRRVVAIQHGRPILNMAASFQVPESGLEHQDEMPEVPRPGELESKTLHDSKALKLLPAKVRRFAMEQRPIDFRPVRPFDLIHEGKLPPRSQVWIRTIDRLPDGDDDLHRCLLAYISDYYLLTTATLPHGLSFFDKHLQLTSLDHAMWFHRPVRVDEWLLYDTDSPSASAGRGFARGRIFAENGSLVATTAQEGVVRLWPEERA
ncbi:MAG: acyl-CoA thioesterase II [Gammaproteobacteria bacterium]